MFMYQVRGSNGVAAKGVRLFHTDEELCNFLLNKFHERWTSLFSWRRRFTDFPPDDVETVLHDFSWFIRTSCRITVLFAGELAPEAQLVKPEDLLDIIKNQNLEHVPVEKYKMALETRKREILADASAE